MDAEGHTNSGATYRRVMSWECSIIFGVAGILRAILEEKSGKLGTIQRRFLTNLRKS